jgi:MFS family permease
VSWLAWSLTHAVSAVAVVTIAANAPAFVMTLIGASYADRYDRRRLMIGTDLARGVLVGIAALLLALGRLNFAPLLAIAPMPVVLIIDALTFAVSAVTVAAIDLPAPRLSTPGPACAPTSAPAWPPFLSFER